MKDFEKQVQLQALANIIDATGIFTHQSRGDTHYLKIWYHILSYIEAAKNQCDALGIRTGDIKTITKFAKRRGVFKYSYNLTINIQDLADKGMTLKQPKDLILDQYRTRRNRVDELDLEMNRKLDLFIDSLSKEQSILYYELLNNHNIRIYRRK